jgi:hypothetical protein
LRSEEKERGQRAGRARREEKLKRRLGRGNGCAQGGQTSAPKQGVPDRPPLRKARAKARTVGGLASAWVASARRSAAASSPRRGLGPAAAKPPLTSTRSVPGASTSSLARFAASAARSARTCPEEKQPTTTTAHAQHPPARTSRGEKQRCGAGVLCV